MIKTIGTVLLAVVMVWSGAAYADGRVLAVVSPSMDELKEPPQKKPAKTEVKKTGKEAKAKKANRKVAAPASKSEAPLQPVGDAPKKAKAAHTSGKKDAKQAAKVTAPEPKVEALSNQKMAQQVPSQAPHQASQQGPNKITNLEKPKNLGQVYVLFQSKPANAEVVVDGYYAGSTPLELPIKEGNHSIRLVYPGYEEWERKFNAYKGMRVNALLVEKKPVSATP